MSDQEPPEIKELREYLESRPIAKNRAAAIAEIINQEIDPEQRRKMWGGYQNTIESYDSTFYLLLNGRSFNDIIDARRIEAAKTGNNVSALDLMSDTSAIRGLNIDFGIALGLAETRPDSVQSEDRSRNLHYLTGDIMDGDVWARVSALMQDQQVKGFDISLNRAIAGIFGIPGKKEAFEFLIQNQWTRLNSHGGMILNQIHPLIGPHLEEYATHLKTLPGIEVDYRIYPLTKNNAIENPILKIVRRPESPKILTFK